MGSLDGTELHKHGHALTPHGHIVTIFLLLQPTHLPSLSVYDHSAVIYNMIVWGP